ncbi:Bax inhibitor-1/YccA family protein [Streptococcus sobrinus]|uniref:BAX inhibitor (BI)-1/YccA family protein n=1 Tax=Streptococcus sobrinus TaxID=1310 RepID=A0ABM6W690_9STRE|nr:BAX inhibitor (BI)-1/YccA family protein [Streptococcus sobrinus]AWN61199.1 BAX inhibitor (BI)-1/YccA family protein [Streptococcus sobrinus]AWN63072.1 BAX inhibitor (BI)-1/YccA family protein [Streptococcus sobrinus]SQG13095.1 integral membrane protein [Streptococcus sobrinus]SQG19234.1 integral membrane protein [Streptococcus sobrinus]
MDMNNMGQSPIITQADAGLSRFFAKIYSLVGMGIGLSAVIAALMLFVFPENMIAIMTGGRMIYLGAIFLELALVFVASSAARRNTPWALPLFLVYSALNGFTMSFVIAAYTGAQVVGAFVSSAAVFFIMAAIGATTKKDLSGMAKALIAGLIGIIIAGLVNAFLGSGMMSLLISVVTVVIFSGLIAYENQIIKRVYGQTRGQVSDGWAISMALSLYLDFINLFLSILNLFGRRN